MGHFELVCLITIFEDFILVPLVNEEEKKKRPLLSYPVVGAHLCETRLTEFVLSSSRLKDQDTVGKRVVGR